MMTRAELSNTYAPNSGYVHLIHQLRVLEDLACVLLCRCSTAILR